MKFISNTDIAKLLRQVAAAYEVKGESFFKIAAYQKAADAVEHSTSEVKDLWDDGKLDSLPGVGSAITSYLDELFKTGKVKHFESVMKELPKGMFSFLDVGRIGPKTAYKIAKYLKVESIDELKKVAKEGKIARLEGFGEKSQEDILQAIEEYRRQTGRYLLPIAYENAQRLVFYLKQLDAVKEANSLGSLRRMASTVGDVDIAVASNEPKKVIKHFIKYHDIQRIIEAGDRTSSILLTNGIQIDLMVQPPEAYGSLLQHFTGSKHHNIHLRDFALKKDYSLSEYGVKVKGRLQQYPTEEGFYNKLGLDWIPPELREDSGEIEAALNHQLPDLVELKDIKGDVHLHSSFDIETSHDLGNCSFEQLIAKAENLSYEYIGLSDHNPSVSQHDIKKIENIVKRRIKLIEQLKSSSKIKLLNLLEVDIMANGTLAVPDQILKTIDGAIAGIHSSMRQSKEMITGRLLSAINNPYICVITHPTGRLLKEREAYEVDWDKIFLACKQKNKVLEINSWPSRLDLPDILVREAVKKKVKMIINTDSHALEHMDNMKYGVSVARRGWAEAKDIINTYSWVDFRKYFRVN